jgi:cobalamin synthase
MNADKAMGLLSAVAIGIFVLAIVLSLTYQGVASAGNQIVSTYGANSGVAANYTKYVTPLPNTFAQNLPLVIIAIVFAVVIGIIVGLYARGKLGGGSISGGVQ